MVSPYKIESLLAGGIKEALIGFYDDDGYFCGEAGTLDPGEYSEMARWYALQNADMAIPTNTRENISGDDSNQGVITFQSEESATVGFQVGVWQAALEADVQNINLYDDDQIAGVVINPQVEEYALACMLFMSTAKKKVFGGRSAVKGWDTYLMNEGEISSNGPDSITERTKRAYTYGGAFNQTSTWPWGVAMSTDSDKEGTEQGAGFHYGSIYKTSMGGFRTDGTADTILLNYTPAGDQTTSAMQVWRIDMATGVVTKLVPGTDFEVDVDNKQLVFGAIPFPVAPAAGLHYVYRYMRAS